MCLIKAVMDLGLDPDKVLDLTVFEIDKEVHKYNLYVFPQRIKTRNETIIDITNVEGDENSVIYLNFCSVPPGDRASWAAYFKNQSAAAHWVPHCCKETVLKYIWEVTHHPYYCTVMISLAIKDTSTTGEYTSTLSRKLGDYFTDLGFLRVLRDSNLFDAELVSVRPEDGIVWDDEMVPKRIKGGKWGCPFVTLLVRPKSDYREAEFAKLDEEFEKRKVADTKEYSMRVGALVYTKEVGVFRISKRTPAKLETEDEKVLSKYENITVKQYGIWTCEELDE